MAVIWVHVLGTQWDWRRTARPFNSMQNCLWNEQKIEISWNRPIRLLAQQAIYLGYRSTHLKCSYFQTPSSCPSGMVKINSIFDGSFLINCCMYCCTANVLSISSNNSSGQRQKSCEKGKEFVFHSVASGESRKCFPFIQFIDTSNFLLWAVVLHYYTDE